MTIAETIKKTVDALPRTKQRKALAFVRGLQKKTRAGSRKRKEGSTGKNGQVAQKEVYVPKDPAVRAIAGIWSDRTDLPKDPVEAVKAIRTRVWSVRSRRNG